MMRIQFYYVKNLVVPSVFEELIHSAQYGTGKNDGSYISRLKCEIEAQEKLLRYQKDIADLLKLRSNKQKRL